MVTQSVSHVRLVRLSQWRQSETTVDAPSTEAAVAAILFQKGILRRTSSRRRTPYTSREQLLSTPHCSIEGRAEPESTEAVVNRSRSCF